jgi:hypothetical protein
MHLATLFQENSRQKRKKKEGPKSYWENREQIKSGSAKRGMSGGSYSFNLELGLQLSEFKRYPLPEKGPKMIEKWGPFVTRKEIELNTWWLLQKL